MEQAEYYAAAKELSSRPVGQYHPKQKFKRGSRVHVCKDMPSYMNHFESNFDAIVEYTYAQKYGGKDIDSYALIVLNDAGTPVNSVAWYEENQLSLLNDDTKAGLDIIEQYNLGRENQ